MFVTASRKYEFCRHICANIDYSSEVATLTKSNEGNLSRKAFIEDNGSYPLFTLCRHISEG